MFENYMKKCFELAKKGLGKTSPNPLVGCVVLDKNGNEISEGFHKKYGENHAERDALLKLKNGEEEGGTLIVNLEPCSHFGKTPPCVDLIIERKIKRVVIAMKDINPLVDGVSKLRAAGIEVIEGVLEKEACELNEIFIKNMKEKKSFIALKTATTLDGKIATKTGDSKWITSEKSRELVYDLRCIYDAVLTSGNTVLADNPKFDVPVKILVDRVLKVDFEKQFFKTGKIFIAHDEAIKPSKMLDNVEFIPCRVLDNKIVMEDLFNKLFDKKIMSIFVEAGGNLNGSLIDDNLVDKIYQFIAPKILGDNFGLSCFSGRNIQKISDCIEFEIQNVKNVNKDLLITYKKAIF